MCLSSHNHVDHIFFHFKGIQQRRQVTRLWKMKLLFHQEKEVTWSIGVTDLGYKPITCAHKRITSKKIFLNHEKYVQQTLLWGSKVLPNLTDTAYSHGTHGILQDFMSCKIVTLHAAKRQWKRNQSFKESIFSLSNPQIVSLMHVE